ncbi:cytoplasmic protein [uncultured Stenotrophomonas sp.]|uniref:cytoplasmic protein n=1 Tax=uncultured Stenotrophomonas sp. TaxID=165438 RepID=UPI0025FA3BD6|nr:cytoplasmic protein [uncultured Stenotrophomonas sp.]
MFDSADIKEAHKYSIRHRGELKDSETCGCFYCLDIFDYKNIEDWIDDGDTALCPSCGIDSVIGLFLGFRLTANFFLP